MSVYDKSGNQLQAVYDKSGQPLNAAYSRGSEQIFPDGPISLKVMSYNVQWFTKINSQQAMQNKIIADNRPDIIGFQEVSKTQSLPTVGANMVSGYPYVSISAHVNYLALVSKIPLFDVINVDYQTQDTAGDGSEIRAYQKCYIEVAGKRIAWFNTHLSYKNATPKYAQMAELFQAAQQEEYCILTGDFNHYALDKNGADYINMYKPFADAGYHLADCNDTVGFQKTASNIATAQTIDDLQSCADNIIVSGNIEIVGVVFDITKLSYLDGNPIDHIPVVATLQIN